MNNEKAFKTMGLAGAADIAIGIVMVVAGVTTGSYCHHQRGTPDKKQKRIDILGSEVRRVLF